MAASSLQEEPTNIKVTAEEIEEQGTIIKSLLINLLNKEVNQKKQVSLSGLSWYLKLIHDELWCCKDDGRITVYDSQLEVKRIIRLHNSVYSAAELDDERVVVAGRFGLDLISRTGEVKTNISSDSCDDVFIHNTTIYAARSPLQSNTIQVYDAQSFTKLYEIQTPCQHNWSDHTLVANDEHIKLCCATTNKLYILDKEGKLLEAHGCSVSYNERQKMNNNISAFPGALYGPQICHTDDDNTILIADKNNKRLQAMDESGEWNVVTLDQELDKPNSAVWWNQTLYVSECNKKLTMFS